MTLGYENTFKENIFGNTTLTKVFHKKIQQDLIALYNSFFFSENGLHSNRKLTIYKEVKKIYQREKYLKQISNFKYRKAICQLRLSAHVLPIETGRHKNIPREERFCTLCNSRKIGDEQHIFI